MANVNQYLANFQSAYDKVKNMTSGWFNWNELYTQIAGQLVTNQMQTELQREESEKAYKRDSAPNQVAQMMSAGMSRSGAVNALNGGGSYTPAPISLTAPDVKGIQSGQIDKILNSLQAFSANTAQMAQLQEQKRQFNIQHAEEKRQFDVTHAETKRMNDDSLKTSSEQRRLLGVEIDCKTLENSLNSILVDIEKELSADGTTINAERAERVARRASAILNDFRDKRIFKVLNDMTDEELESLFEIQGIMNTLTRITDYDAPRVINDVYQYAKKALKKFF